MHIKLSGEITANYSGLRLDQALAKLFPDYSRAQCQQWIKQGAVSVDGNCIDKTRYKVMLGQHINISADVAEQGDWQAQDIPLNIIYEDDTLLVINKPAGLVVHPGAGNPDQTLMNALLHHDPNLIHIPRAGIIHRLDKDTSGLLVVARQLDVHNHLTQAMSQRKIKREYQAVVHGTLISGGTVEAPIDRHPNQRTKMAVKNGGRDAVTHYRIAQKFPWVTHITCQLESGRTHQIRVHMQHINHPLVGDKTYTHKRGIPGKMPQIVRDYLAQFPRQALHAWRLTLHHPSTGEALSWEAPLPNDFKALLSFLEDHTHD